MIADIIPFNKHAKVVQQQAEKPVKLQFPYGAHGPREVVKKQMAATERLWDEMKLTDQERAEARLAAHEILAETMLDATSFGTRFFPDGELPHSILSAILATSMEVDTGPDATCPWKHEDAVAGFNALQNLPAFEDYIQHFAEFTPDGFMQADLRGPEHDAVRPISFLYQYVTYRNLGMIEGALKNNTQDLALDIDMKGYASYRNAQWPHSALALDSEARMTRIENLLKGEEVMAIEDASNPAIIHALKGERLPTSEELIAQFDAAISASQPDLAPVGRSRYRMPALRAVR